MDILRRPVESNARKSAELKEYLAFQQKLASASPAGRAGVFEDGRVQAIQESVGVGPVAHAAVQSEAEGEALIGRLAFPGG